MDNPKLLHAFAPTGDLWATIETTDGLRHHQVAYLGMVEYPPEDGYRTPWRTVQAYGIDGTELDVSNLAVLTGPCDNNPHHDVICDGHPKDPS